jgi:hypothetical protein
LRVLGQTLEAKGIVCPGILIGDPLKVIRKQ